MTIPYQVPVDPADPESAALDMIVQVAVALAPGDTGWLRDALQDFCGLLQVDGALSGLAWSDARHVAAAISYDVCNRDDAAAFLRRRAELTEQSHDNMVWRDRQRVVAALRSAATVYETM